MTEPKYIEFAIGQQGADFIEHMLRSGRAFSQAVAKESVVVPETVTTLLPEGTSRKVVEAVRSGGVAHGNAPRAWLVEKIQTYLSSDAANVVVFEDLLAKPSDGWLERGQSRVLAYGETVLHVLLSEDVSEFAITTTIADAASPTMLTAFFTELPDDFPTVEPRAQLDESAARALVAAVRSVSLLAYDGEGYVVANLQRRSV